jgi:hypothetical protein
VAITSGIIRCFENVRISLARRAIPHIAQLPLGIVAYQRLELTIGIVAAFYTLAHARQSDLPHTHLGHEARLVGL